MGPNKVDLGLFVLMEVLLGGYCTLKQYFREYSSEKSVFRLKEVYLGRIQVELVYLGSIGT